MANDQDFILKNALEVGKDTKVTLGTITVGATGYNLANASYDSVSFSVAAQETSPQGVFLKPDGTKMYVVGNTGDDINEYNLGTAWNVSTASFVQVFSVAAQEATPVDVSFKPDGTKMYILGNTGVDINEYNLSTAWDISTASYLQNFSVSGQETNPLGFFFKPDGTKMYVIGLVGVDVNEYNLSTAWNISTASFVQVFSVAAQEATPRSVFFKPDGTKMYVAGSGGDDVNEYSLSTAWNISTSAYVQNFSVFAQDDTPRAVLFKDDGTKMYILGGTTTTIYQYSTIAYNNDVSLSTGNYFAEALAGNTTYTFSNAGAVQAFQMEITGASTYTITWPASVEWPFNGTAPNVPGAGETDIYTFVTDDGGTSYIGLLTADAV
jgi:6-phosphogluconolactonase (cycloisomerase 2 family)